jgi:hypothetical protein
MAFWPIFPQQSRACALNIQQLLVMIAVSLEKEPVTHRRRHRPRRPQKNGVEISARLFLLQRRPEPKPLNRGWMAGGEAVVEGVSPRIDQATERRCGVKSCNHAFLAKTMSVHVSARFQDPHLVVPTLLLFFRVLVSDISGSALALVGERWATKASGRRMRTGSRRR